MKLALSLALVLLASCTHQAEHESLMKTLAHTGSADGPPPLITEPRTSQLTRYPCAKCHTKPLNILKQTRPAAHWEVKLQHAPGVLTECKTCHSETAMEQLVLINGKTAELNNSHELCAQCHSRQAADWRGGAHGKRTSGWASERRVLTCAGCHNPHQPRLAPRFPSISRKHSEETP